MKREAIVMSSSSSDDDEAEATEQPKVLPDEESNAMVVTSISPTEHSVRPKLRAWRLRGGGECGGGGGDQGGDADRAAAYVGAQCASTKL